MTGRLPSVRGRRRGTARPIRYLGDPVLRTPTDEVTSFDRELSRLVDDMFASMYEAEGVGLAANQIGVGLSVFVYDCHDASDEWHVGHVVNPRLVSTEGETIADPEGCLSLPFLSYDTPRYFRAAVEGADLHGEPLRIEGDGYLARCLQHESGHLQGQVYIDTLIGGARREAMRDIRAADWSH
ncbi:MAG: peptide deformylase [Mycobacteriales bacterium]